ncbi:hypothetical protein SAMD00019534_083830 [Acytostelium subglobosum LB1]|uniref:hypothetical protein n=1 Tax=Acytostelium subglobosum LB1 TaxID=1410327 RepID=UPI0006451454|nr:hypothetical protein SAMD00019534_083830 [Acytostelium subglobosum LB1]GAM25208.1 hypothetical protein SAMD00019534_083830 [Acytostelium subglobosum LB1]|eukprot:XP_012751728.1 hypothetical protein SAMD00019534_083830 [Acytostelium subglobosum LB1]
MFTNCRGVTVEESIVENIFEITNGHAGLVNMCGRALDEVLLRDGDSVTLAQWQRFCIYGLPQRMHSYKTVDRMAKSLLVDDETHGKHREALRRFIISYPETRLAEGESTNFLLSEGFLVPVYKEDPNNFEQCALQSSLLRSYCLKILHGHSHPKERFPLTGNLIDIPKLLGNDVLHLFSAVGRDISTKMFKGAGKDLNGVVIPHDSPVPSESFYHFEFFSVINAWIRSDYQARETLRIASSVSSGANKKADMVIKSKDRSYVLEFVANTNQKDFEEHCKRTSTYQSFLAANQAWVIHFTLSAHDYTLPTGESKVGVITVRHSPSMDNWIMEVTRDAQELVLDNDTQAEDQPMEQ